MPRIARYCLAAYGIDCAFYLTLTGVPYKAIRLGADPVTLGLLPAVWSVVYITGSGILGRLSDRLPRIAMARLGTLVLAAAILILTLSRGLPGLFAGMPVAAAGLALFWPALQAALAEADVPERLRDNLGLFNVSWSLGKGSGFLAGGFLLSALGFNALFGTALTLVALVALFLRPAPAPATPAGNPPEPFPGREPEATRPAPAGSRAPGSRRRFLLMAWLANGTAYGVAATLNYHYPGHLDRLNLGSTLFGTFLGFTYFSQTLTFLALKRTGFWPYRRWPLYVLQTAMSGTAWLLPGLRSAPGILSLAPVIGMGMGLAYYSSIYYSLHAAEARGRGRNTGLHEAIIGSGVLILPPLGGALASLTGRLETPFYLAGGFCLLAVMVQEAVVRRAAFQPARA